MYSNEEGIHSVSPHSQVHVRIYTCNNGSICVVPVPGWESQLLETGFLAIFLSPILSLRQLPKLTPTPWSVVWGYRWLVFRLMLGAVGSGSMACNTVSQI